MRNALIHPAITAFALCLTILVRAEAGEASASQPAVLSVAAVFNDHLVLQQGMPIPVWGKAQPGATIQVVLRDRKATAVADAQGTWQVRLDALTAEPDQKPTELVIADGSTTLRIADVLIGEVWLGSGQSNMEMACRSYIKDDAVLAAAVKAAPYPEIRLLTSGGNHGHRRHPHLEDIVLGRPRSDERQPLAAGDADLRPHDQGPLLLRR
jgi:hypothetical protein